MANHRVDVTEWCRNRGGKRVEPEKVPGMPGTIFGVWGLVSSKGYCTLSAA